MAKHGTAGRDNDCLLLHGFGPFTADARFMRLYLHQIKSVGATNFCIESHVSCCVYMMYVYDVCVYYIDAL
eukprot:COSAG05_NODE_1341_length_5140_cov_4.176949_4_plen_71_part_00